MLTERIHPILLVEDESDDVSFVRRALQKNGIVNELTICASLAAAKAVIEDAARPLPVLAIVDLFLPNGETGLQFLDWLRRQGPTAAAIPAMMYSVSADDAHRREASALHSVGFLQKPATEDALATAVQALGFVVTTTIDGGRARRVIERR